MTNTALAEHTSSAAPAHLDRARAGKLLRECGYDLVERFDHVHATRDTQEWHLCLVTDLASMPPVRLLACLEEALTLRVEPASFSHLTHEEGVNMRRNGREPFMEKEAP